MACDILIRTWRRDLAWLELCLAAVDRNAVGFSSVVVVLPRASLPWLRRRVDLPAGVRLELCSDYSDDYLGQQVTKLNADRYTDAEFVCHLDSDCILGRRTTPDDLLPGGRPRVVMRRYTELGRHWPWQRPTEEFLGFSVDFDFMQEPPFVYPRSLYADVRAWAEKNHGLGLDEYVLTRGPRGFSEFNVLGAYAYRHRYDDFVWCDASQGGVAEPRCQWYWSWAGVDAQTRARITCLLDAGQAQ